MRGGDVDLHPELQVIINNWVVKGHATYSAEHKKRTKYERKHDGSTNIAEADFAEFANLCS